MGLNPEDIPEGLGNAHRAALWAESEEGKEYAKGDEDRQKAYDAEAERYAAAQAGKEVHDANTEFSEDQEDDQTTDDTSGDAGSPAADDENAGSGDAESHPAKGKTAKR